VVALRNTGDLMLVHETVRQDMSSIFLLAVCMLRHLNTKEREIFLEASKVYDDGISISKGAILEAEKAVEPIICRLIS